MTSDFPPDADINDFNYLAMSLEAEAALGEACGYVSLDAIHFYVEQMRRLYQQTEARNTIIQLVFTDDGSQPA